MQEQHSASPFALAEQALLAALPKRIVATDEDLAKIKLPGYRYDAIEQSVLRMYKRTNACVMPLPILDIVNDMSCSIMPYRSFGKRIHDVLMQASPDAVTLQFIGSVRPAILYNDRQPSGRINFSILHEIGHIQLDHKEPSQLAELEANHFAAVALCPLDLLERYNITEPKTIIDLFGVSEDCARNRLRALNNSRNIPRSTARLQFRRAVIERFQFKRPPQLNLFGEYVFYKQSSSLYQQSLLFEDNSPAKTQAYDKRNAPHFLRNQFLGGGKYDIPLIRKQSIDLTSVGLIACTNTCPDDQEYFDYGVHFFVDDYDFGSPYEAPDKTYALYSQYRFCLTPDYSVYAEMPAWRQIESVAHSRWCGAWWQSRGMKVIPTVSWDRYPSFDYCFEGIEPESIVAIATYACRQAKSAFLRGYDAMLERIDPQEIICYGTPLHGMRGNIIPVNVCHPRQFHRELKRKKQP